ncbi:chorion class CB protein PC404-like [Aricia agestis]|uniref:chorion class CB protein PC404-like n=1 Tax=Aricia agestis TaxID=91739 RepID=UPI001C20847D|nr:chorion class CB protein PC404-like [Aricia agestis]
MFHKALVCFLSAVIIVQTASTQCIGAYDRASLGVPWTSAIEQLLGPAIPPGVGTFGGSFAVTSLCPISPRGLSITSENYYDGSLRIVGEVPFLSTISVEGAVPSVGAGAITYGCGSGTVAMLSEDEPWSTPGYGYGPAAKAGFNTCPCGRVALV